MTPTPSVSVSRWQIERVLALLAHTGHCAFCGTQTQGILAPDQMHRPDCPAPEFFDALVLTQPEAPAPALPAEVREVLLLVAGWLEAQAARMDAEYSSGTSAAGLNVQRLKHEEVQAWKKVAGLDPTRLRALAGAGI